MSVINFLRKISTGMCLNASVLIITSLIAILVLNHYYSYNYLFNVLMDAGDKAIPLLLDKTNLTSSLLQIYQINASYDGMSFDEMHHNCEVYGVVNKDIEELPLQLPCFTCESLLKFNNGSECVLNYRKKIKGINSINSFLSVLSDFCNAENSLEILSSDTNIPCLNCQDLRMYSKPEQCLNQTFYSLYTNNLNNSLIQGVLPFNSTISLEEINKKTKSYSGIFFGVILLFLGLAFLISSDKTNFPKIFFRKLFVSNLFSGSITLLLILLLPKLEILLFQNTGLNTSTDSFVIINILLNGILKTPLIALTITNLVMAFVGFAGFLILKFTLKKKSKKEI